jgi:hypothetical protein
MFYPAQYQTLPASSPNMSLRLSIVVPYRDRPAQLKQFIQHTSAYFSRDKIDREIPYRVLVVEQEPGLPFNRGAIKNVGFVLTEAESDYTCFHDVDFLPMWADYRPVDTPTPIVWYGAEVRIVGEGHARRPIAEDQEAFFGGAVIFPNPAFRQINGYANEYWGWGYEDTDVRERTKAARMSPGRRLGTFLPLPHVNEGYRPDGQAAPIQLVNKQIFDEMGRRAPLDRGGLSTLKFEVLGRQPIDTPAINRQATWEIVTVRLNLRPRHEQIAALATPGAPALERIFHK